jgi:uncharacterized protein (TIGR00369 family)
MKEIAKYSGCFVCGEKNSIGLKARFYFDDGRAVTELKADKQYEGYLNVFHGGITSTLLDEVMIKALLAQGYYTMTVELNIRFLKAVRTGQKLYFQGVLEKSKGRLFFTRGEARTEEGEIVASATGKYLKVNDELKIELLKSLER